MSSASSLAQFHVNTVDENTNTYSVSKGSSVTVTILLKIPSTSVKGFLVHRASGVAALTTKYIVQLLP